MNIINEDTSNHRGRLDQRRVTSTSKTDESKVKKSDLQKETSTCWRHKLLNDIIPTNIRDRGSTDMPTFMEID